METRCPTCETIFRLTNVQATAASGMVQCGICNGFFNAMNNRCDENAKAADAKSGKVAATGGIISAIKYGEGMEMPAILAEGYIPLRPKAPWWSTMLWTVVILLALVGTLAQMAWFNVDQVYKQEELKPYIDQACQHVPCQLEKPRDLEKIELLSRDVRSHPTRKGALLITAAFINRAEFEQPYPIIALTLSNLTGEIIAYRHFTPEEYLSDETGEGLLMTPGVPGTMIMEVVDPGNETVSYRFDFL